MNCFVCSGQIDDDAPLVVALPTERKATDSGGETVFVETSPHWFHREHFGGAPGPWRISYEGTPAEYRAGPTKA